MTRPADSVPSRARPWRRASAALALAAATAAAVATAAPPLRVGCLIQPESIAEVGSSVVGAVETLHVERGDLVRKGQVLATLKADVERASLSIAQARAQSDAEVQAAQSNLDFLRQKQARTEDLVKKNFLSQQVLEQARAEADIAAQKLTQATEQRRILRRELDLAQAQLEVRNIRAPIDGVVAERYVATGERIDQKQMFRIARIDPLRVELIVPASLFGTIQAGTTTEITPDVPGIGAREARVVLVDRIIDAGSNTFRVRASLPNPGGAIPAGARCNSGLVPAARAEPAKAAAGPLRPAAYNAPADDGVRTVLEPRRRAGLQ
ncbi:MAG: efflux RND transporter periplasmic adaptor subunit [Burkholderiales bacterium]|nr:efflux RND transporter periplasmic adaptor subunit [Burkholderiales bacterium]